MDYRRGLCKAPRRQHVQAEAEKMSLSETIRHAYPGDARVLRLLIYKRDSVMAARDFLLNLLGGFQTPVIERRRDFASVLSAIWRLPTPKI